MSLSIHQPHDHFCKRALADVAVAKDLLSHHLPPAILADIDWNTFRLTNKSFVNEKLKETHSDIIFQCMLGKDTCYLYLVVEHQSTPDKLLPFRQLSYNVSLMEQHLKEGNDYLPLIINICLYAGTESPYPYSQDPFDCFKNPQRARDLMFKSSILIDLTTLSEETLETYGKADLLALLLKQAIQRDYLKWIQENKEKFFILLKRGYGVSGSWYILATDDKTEPDTLLKALTELAPYNKENIMSAAQQLRQEGKKERNLEVARNMLVKLHLDVDTVQKATELTKEELQEILEEGNNTFKSK